MERHAGSGWVLGVLLLWVGAAMPACGRGRLSIAEAARHVGETATVCGVVVGTHYAIDSRGSPTFLNLGRPYPEATFIVVIWGDRRPIFERQLGRAPESVYQRQEICVTGRIATYGRTPQIEAQDPSQIEVPGTSRESVFWTNTASGVIATVVAGMITFVAGRLFEWLAGRLGQARNRTRRRPRRREAVWRSREWRAWGLVAGGVGVAAVLTAVLRAGVAGSQTLWILMGALVGGAVGLAGGQVLARLRTRRGQVRES
jgi:hypothetical protein